MKIIPTRLVVHGPSSCVTCRREILRSRVPRDEGSLAGEPDHCGWCGRSKSPEAIQREVSFARPFGEVECVFTVATKRRSHSVTGVGSA